MISEGSCDTEDLSNGSWKCSFAMRNQLIYKLYNSIIQYKLSYFKKNSL